jgi:putative ABC transport system ATP-binding protein
LHNLTKQYKRGITGFYAVEHINMQINKGEFICIIGNSGSGKSTLLNMIAGLLRPTEGNIIIEGQNMSGKKQSELDRFRNHKLGYVMQGQNLLANFNVFDNLCMPYYLSGGKENIQQRALWLLDQVGLLDIKDMYPSQLSGGELRRIAIARAMILNPVLIIADEPTSNLDPDNSKKIMQLFQSISQAGTTVMVSTHDLEFLKYAQITYKITCGKLELLN